MIFKKKCCFLFSFFILNVEKYKYNINFNEPDLSFLLSNHSFSFISPFLYILALGLLSLENEKSSTTFFFLSYPEYIFASPTNQLRDNGRISQRTDIYKEINCLSIRNKCTSLS